MTIDAVGVASSNLKETVRFYTLLGFTFESFAEDEQHLEPQHKNGARLMIDSKKLITEILGEEPRASNHSSFAIKYDSPEEVNKAAEAIAQAGFKIAKEPWDAFWGQRYCIVEDPDGYKIDLFCNL
ncbi:MAG: VOC family protein [Candidatus Dojkabacteria bacterium]|nr:MAG: VOC family protein [Candidatus Dojkabacteria bacterium]